MKKKNPGKIFEEDFKNSVPPYAELIRLKDSSANFNKKTNCPRCKSEVPINTGFKSKNKCDYLIYSYPNFFAFELKSYTGKSLSFNAVAEHQKEGLTQMSRRKGITAGVIVNFRDVGETYFMSIEVFNECYSTLESKSIPIKIFRDYATVIPCESKISRNSYDIDSLLRGENKPLMSMFKTIM